MFGPKKGWLAYDDGSFEPVDPGGNLNLKKRGPEREDWWVVEKDQGWSPPRGKQRPMNAPSKAKAGTYAAARETTQRSQSILSQGMEAASVKQAKPKGASSFIEGEWDWWYKERGLPIPDRSKKRPHVFDELPRYPYPGGVVMRDPGPTVEKDPGPNTVEQDPWYQLGQNLGGLIWGGKGAPRQNPQQATPPEAELPPESQGDFVPVDYPPAHFPMPKPKLELPLKSAHAAARLTPVTAKGKPEVRLLDNGLDPEVEVKGMQAAQSGRAHGDVSGQGAAGRGQGQPNGAAQGSAQGSAQGGQGGTDNSPLPSWLSKMPTPKPKEHNPDQIDQGIEGMVEDWEEKNLQKNFLKWLEDNPTAFMEQSSPSLIGLFTKELLDQDPGHKGVGGVAMKLGEVANANRVERLYREYEDVIENSAKENGIDANLLRAIIREETSHKLPGEDLIGDSVGPCQIRASLWGKKFGLSKEQLKDEATNIDIAARILGEEQARLKEQGIEITPEMLASRYNSGSTTEVTDYGIRVREFYNFMK